MARKIHEIASEILQDWKKPYFGAIPYIEAMLQLNTIHEDYYLDTAKSVVIYFLANAQTWRGETARRIKAELREMLKEV